MSGRLRLAVFDMDGTLIDSERVIVEAMRLTYDAFGAPAPTAEATRRIIGLSLPEVFRRLSPDAAARDHDRLVELYKTSFVSLRAETGGEAEAPLFPGARAALDGLAGGGWLISAATGKARRGFDHAVEAHGLHGIFSYPQTADDARSKPHPEMVQRSISLHGVEPGDTVVIGDTSYDMEMARAAGARAIGVAWGYHPANELREAGAEAIIARFGDLAAAAERLVEAR